MYIDLTLALCSQLNVLLVVENEKENHDYLVKGGKIGCL